MKAKRSTFSFKQTNTPIDEVVFTRIETLYRFYHKRFWCYKKTFQRLKHLNLFSKLGSSSLIVAGTIAGGITLNPVILGTIAGAGVLLKTFTDYMHFERKIEMCKYAFTTYEKVLIELTSHLRGEPFDFELFIRDMKLIDENVTDLCPTLDNRIIKQYEAKFQ